MTFVRSRRLRFAVVPTCIVHRPERVAIAATEAGLELSQQTKIHGFARMFVMGCEHGDVSIERHAILRQKPVTACT